jgi:hypothetical protein
MEYFEWLNSSEVDDEVVIKYSDDQEILKKVERITKTFIEVNKIKFKRGLHHNTSYRWDSLKPVTEEWKKEKKKKIKLNRIDMFKFSNYFKEITDEEIDITNIIESVKKRMVING